MAKYKKIFRQLTEEEWQQIFSLPFSKDEKLLLDYIKTDNRPFTPADLAGKISKKYPFDTKIHVYFVVEGINKIFIKKNSDFRLKSLHHERCICWEKTHALCIRLLISTAQPTIISNE